jgi:hypothetical protein
MLGRRKLQLAFFSKTFADVKSSATIVENTINSDENRSEKILVKYVIQSFVKDQRLNKKRKPSKEISLGHYALAVSTPSSSVRDLRNRRGGVIPEIFNRGSGVIVSREKIFYSS